MLVTTLICDGQVHYSSVDTHKHSQVSRSFKKLLKQIYGMHASLVHMSVKLKSSCTIEWGWCWC